MKPVILTVALLCLLGACQEGVPDGDWTSYGRTLTEERYSPLTQVNRDSVSRLGLAWWTEFDTNRGQEATPLVADGVLYTTTAWSKVYAFDAKSGGRLWEYDPEVPGQTALSACCDVVNRGPALWKGKVYVGTLDGRLIALDAKTGTLSWSVQTTDVNRPYTITGAPRVVDGKVLIGNGGGEYGVRGYVSAYDADSGDLSWRFYTTPNPEGKADGAASDAVFAEKANATWFGEAWKQSGGGGTVWDSIAYDPQSDLVYIGVGNGSPWSHLIRSEGKGDNFFLSSIVALDPRTGTYVWHYQVNPGDTWDYTATQSLIITDLDIAGRKRRVVMQAPKNGFFYVLDAKTGELLAADKFAPWVNWASAVDLKTGRPVEAPGARWGDNGRIALNPGPLGAHNWKPMAFSPQERLVYIPAQDESYVFTGTADPKAYRHVNGVWNLGTGTQGVGGMGNNGRDRPPVPPTVAPPPIVRPPSRGMLIAWDPAARKARWSLARENLWAQGGVLVADNLVFQGVGLDLKAYAAADGTELWSYPLGAPALAAPISYAVDGVQYVAVMVGNGGGTSTGDPLKPGRLMVFTLDGKAKADPFAPTSLPPAVDVSLAQASTGDPAAGRINYRRYCTICHGANNIYPDLRTSGAILNAVAFKAVVHDGALAPGGMASFAAFMTESDVEDIRAHLLGTYAQPAPSR